MELLVLSPLEKVFFDEKPSVAKYKSFSMLKNERSSFQIALRCEKDCELTVEISGELSGKTCVFAVREVPVGNACFDDADDFYLRKSSGLYPDILMPVETCVKVSGGGYSSLWFEVSPNGEYIGESVLNIKISNGKETAETQIKIDVIDASLPSQELIYTNWFHCDCLCNYYNVEPFSEEFWRICANFVKTASVHGMNCILTPLFTPPLDTRVGGERRTVQLVKVTKSGGGYNFDFRNFRKWVSVCHENGIEYFEMSHLFTQWGAKHAPKIIAVDRKGREKKIFGWKTRTASRKYDKFLRSFAKELIKAIDSEGIREKCFFHVSDEPSDSHLSVYKKRANLIKEIFPGFRVIDALSDFGFYENGAVAQPIPAEDHIEAFVGKVPELWTYYCCGQGKKYVPNRFVSMPSQRNRILGILLYKYDIKGFLQWGYNFYNSQYSIKAIDPYKITDAGGGFPSGDSFVVYPAENGEATESLRLKVFYDGLQDLASLRLLEKKIGREKVLELIEKGLAKPLSFTDYPHEAEWLLETRKTINQMIKEN